MTNRLSDASSPYLRQHADNPVHWWQWGPEAFAEARRRDVPVFVSIGYAACHWCHVMAHESFADIATAEQLNRDFVAVKVDREERPDVDSVYMDATVGMTGQGGWPMSVFCTGEGRPFFCGTYYPPHPRGGMPGFREVLTAISRTWRERRDTVDSVAASAVRVIGDHDGRRGGTATTDERLLRTAVASVVPGYDRLRGGLGGAPKFPVPVLHRGVLDVASGTAAGMDATARAEAIAAVDVSLDAMAAGGIHDHLAGGFARYSVDADWAVPHFEKMLYDNALLLRLYAERSLRARVAGDTARADRLLAVCRGIGDWLDIEMDTGRGYASSLDADSPPVDRLPDDGGTADGAGGAAGGHPVEGAAYVWTPGQLLEALDEEDARRVAAEFGVDDRGCFEHGTSTLRRPRQAGDLDPGWWQPVRRRLLEARRRRPVPGRDDKVICEWNGQAVSGLVALARATDDPDERRRLLDRAADIAAAVHPEPGESPVRSRLGGGAATAPAGLADHAALAVGWALLAAETGRADHLAAARDLVDRAVREFPVPGAPGRWYDAAADEALPVRPSDVTDGATPCGASQLAEALVLLSALVEPESAAGYRELAEATVGDAAGLLARAPAQAGGWMSALQLLRSGPATVTVRGPGSAEAARRLRTRLDPTVLVLHDRSPSPTRPGDPESAAAGGRPEYLVCRGPVCLPATGDEREVPVLLAGA